MALLAHAVSFRKPGGDFVVDLLDALEAKGVEMIARGKSLDPAEAPILQAPRQNYMAVNPVLSND